MKLRVLVVLVWAAASVGAQPGGEDDPTGPETEPQVQPLVQPETPPDPSGPPEVAPAEAGSMEVAANLWGVIGRYRYTATADRVRVTLVQPGGRSDMHSLVVRCVPGAAGFARLELGDMTLVAGGGVLRAIHEHDPTSYAELAGGDGASPAGVLRRLLPPLAIPQLSLAFDPAEVDWCPLVEGLVWEHAERVRVDGADGVRLRGRSAVGGASLVLAAARVRRFEADLDADGGTRLIVECEPLETGDPAAWGLDVGSRWRVDVLGALRPLGARVGEGDRLPRARLITAGDHTERRLGAEGEPVAFAESRLYLVLLMRDDMAPARAAVAARVAASAMAETRRELVRGQISGGLPKRLRLVELLGVIQAQTSGGILERIASQTEVWEGAVGESLPPDEPRPVLAWFADESRLIDRLVPGAEAVLVMHDGLGVVRSVLPIGPEADAGVLQRALVEAAGRP